MDLTSAIDWLGDDKAVALGGIGVGVLFGACAQRSGFCLRSAVMQFMRGSIGDRLSVWLLAFSVAVIGTQFAAATGLLELSEARQIAARGSLSGAAIGGAMFGAGMILARGCASRLLVLSANGNLRALLSGLIFAVTAQAALYGVLSPLRMTIASWWTIEGGAGRDLLAIAGVGPQAGVAFGLVWFAAAIVIGLRSDLPLKGWIGGAGAGLAVALGWALTYAISQRSFDPVEVESLSFTGPSADALMLVLSPPGGSFDFDVGLMPGVFLGSFLAAWWAGELKLEGFQGGPAMRRYIAGAMLMGFGGMLAGGCAVGNGLTGGAAFALTAWIALSAMWAAAAFTDWLVDRRPARIAAIAA